MLLTEGALEEILVPLLQGEVCTQYTRCGKTTCRCREGHLHGPYYYRVWRDGEAVRKEYVRRERLAEVQASCAAYKALMEHLKLSRQARGEIEKNIRSEWRKSKAHSRDAGAAPRGDA